MSRHKDTPEITKPSGQSTPPEVKKALAFVGLMTRAAKVAGVTRSHANKVAKGERRSPRVLKAIVAEVRKIDRASERAA